MSTIEYSTLSDAGEVRRPHTSYLICTTNRSGSNLLCEILASTGLVGRPRGHFCEDYASVAFEQWGCSTIADYVTAWRQYFEQWGIAPFGVVYEDFVEAQEATVVQILRFVDILIPEPLVFGERRLKRQADALSEEWVRRYHTLKDKNETS